MDVDKVKVLDAFYQVEQKRLQLSIFDSWTRPAEVAAALPETDPHHGDTAWVRQKLEELWLARIVLQIPDKDEADCTLSDFQLEGMDIHGEDERKLRIEDNDCRGSDVSDFEQAALYPETVPVLYRSRVAEIARLLSLNYQRFKMAPATGVIRYERLQQKRPERIKRILDLEREGRKMILEGELKVQIEGIEFVYKIDSDVQRQALAQAVSAVLQALNEHLGEKDTLASFQVGSILATLCGLYCGSFRKEYAAHVVTAGVGSGKSFAFQIGALMHVAYKALLGESGVRVVLLYPRVALAANQFKDLFRLVDLVTERLDVEIKQPCLDAGGQLRQQMGFGEQEAGGTFKAIQKAYTQNYSIIISNLDTLANRLIHPEACCGLTRDIDLIVLDEIHLLSGLYGSHAKMMIKRIELMRAMWKLRASNPHAHFEKLMAKHDTVESPYYIGASATIAEPCVHTGRILDREESTILHFKVETPLETGWIHHIFLRQRHEVSSMTALVNATSCLIHNRSNGLFRDYYEMVLDDGDKEVALSQLSNPILPDRYILPRAAENVHKTIGFSDSLDNVGRWADLVCDNERTKLSEMMQRANPEGSYPYFMRFQEPLWRVVHHWSFATQPIAWQDRLRSYYGNFCRDCKRGIKWHIPREPSGLNKAQQRRIRSLWDFTPENKDSFLRRLDVGLEYVQAPWFKPLHDAAQAKTITNMEDCAFFQCGLCWWWSQDHGGNNAPRPATRGNPLNGVKMAGRRPDQAHHFVNGIRVSSFTSNTPFDAMALNSINDVFRSKANIIFRDGNRNFGDNHEENFALVIGSPRLEVGIDLTRARDGITFQGMRNPSSLQQKVGRIGRELHSDSIVVHIVTQNPRDHYYFRNPHIALDPNYLQPVPLHENNLIIARHHFFMAIIDFICLQGSNPGDGCIKYDGERIDLVNDHKYSPSFSNWHKKVIAVYDYLFGNHPRRDHNYENLKDYLRCLGAQEEDLSDPSEYIKLTPADAPCQKKVGVLDVFQHEFGRNFFLTPIQFPLRNETTLAEVCSTHILPPIQTVPNLPRHEHFLKTYNLAPPGISPDPRRDRSYLWNLLKLSLFRRGIPAKNIPGNQPFVWAPNLFAAVGNETVRIFEETEQGLRELGYESISKAISLLLPGTITYRFTSSPRKVPVSQFAAQGKPIEIAPLTQAVYLRIDDPNYFELAPGCPELQYDDLPSNFVGNAPVQVYTPRQISVIRSASEPMVTLVDGMMADGDSRPKPPEGGAAITIMAPPRSFSLKWFRVSPTQASPVKCRFRESFASYAVKSPLPPFPQPKIFSIFSSVDYDPNLDITEFAWGLDRQFATRQTEAARLVFRNPVEDRSVAIGHRYEAPGVIFCLETDSGSPIHAFLDELVGHVTSGAYQSLLLQALYAFLSQYALNPPEPGQPSWVPRSEPSPFTVRDLKTVIMFHLMERWHPTPESGNKPTGALVISLDELVGCFKDGNQNYVQEATFDRICREIARLREPVSVEQHYQSLRGGYQNFLQACAHADQFSPDLFRKTALEILINSLGLAIHSAALRLTGAEEENLSYFYKIYENNTQIFLFDRDAFGNGTSELIRNYLSISAAERVLLEKLRVLGNPVDPLPSTDFARCLEEELQECEFSQAAHLAFHNKSAGSECFRNLQTARRGERKLAGPLFDFLSNELGLTSFDHLIPFQSCPEFLAYVSEGYPAYVGKSLVGSRDYPVYQALDSAMGFCLYGCISCILSPEKNISGSLNARETANSLALNMFYQSIVCESEDSQSRLCYPGIGPARTVPWKDHAHVVTSTMGKELDMAPIELKLPVRSGEESQNVVVIPTVIPAGWNRVFRPNWEPAPTPEESVRPRMEY